MKIQDYEAIFEDLPRLQDDWKKVLLGKKQAYTGGASFAVFGLIPESKRKLALSPIMLTKAQKNKVRSYYSEIVLVRLLMPRRPKLGAWAFFGTCNSARDI